MFSLWKRGLAELVGTALLVLVGPGTAVAQGALGGATKAPFLLPDLFAVAVAFGLIVAAMVYSIGKVSGCHINPAVTFAMAVTKRLPWKDAPVYWVAQFVGAVIGGLLIYAAFGTHTALGGGQTAYGPSTSMLTAFGAEVVGTGILLFTILGIFDSRSPSDLGGLVVGFVIVGIILYLGPVTGASLNPARTFGTEAASQIFGGPTHWDQYVPVYLVAQFVGAAVAAFVYDFLAKPDVEENPIKEGVTEATPHGHTA